MNFFKLYIGDYQRDTAHLSITEHGAYLLMLQHFYATERPLPTGKALYRMLRADGAGDKEAIDAVAQQFWTETPQGLVNLRAHEEIDKAGTQANTNRRIAVEREAKRKDHEPSTNRSTTRDTKRATNRSTIDEPIHSQTPDTRTKNQTPDSRGESADSHPNQPDDVANVPREAQPGDGSGGGTEAAAATVTHRTRAGLSDDFGDFAMASYPPCTGRRSWSTALHHAAVIVAAGKATEADLRRRIAGYRAFFEAGSLTPEFVYTPQNWFDHLAEDPPCFREWAAPATKAQQQQDANVDAAEAFLNRDRGAA